MSQSFKLEIQERAGTAAGLRNQGKIPAVLYGHGLTSQTVAVDEKQFSKVFSRSGYTSLLTLTTKGADHMVLVREVQHHPTKDKIVHVDFYKVRLDEKVRAQVPLSFVGEAPAVKDLGGVLVKNIDVLDLEALPQDLPHDIRVDISGLTDFEKAIHVSDLAVPKGITVFTDRETVVALVQPPRSEQELEALAEEVKEDVEAVEAVEKPKAEEEAAEGAEEAVPTDEKKEKE